MSKRYKFIVMYEATPTKTGKVRTVNKQLEADIKRVVKKYGYKFIGEGYDFTNERKDIEYWCA